MRLFPGVINFNQIYSSVQLLGDLLFHITGISGKMSSESGGDESLGSVETQKAIINKLGEDVYNRVMAGLYMCRFAFYPINYYMRQDSSYSNFIKKRHCSQRSIICTSCLEVAHQQHRSNYPRSASDPHRAYSQELGLRARR